MSLIISTEVQKFPPANPCYVNPFFISLINFSQATVVCPLITRRNTYRKSNQRNPKPL